MTKKWIYDEDDEPRLFYGDEDFNGSAYPCDDPFFMKIIADKLNELEEKNEQFKKALQIAYNETKLTEQTRQTLKKIAKLTGVELE